MYPIVQFPFAFVFGGLHGHTQMPSEPCYEKVVLIWDVSPGPCPW